VRVARVGEKIICTVSWWGK